MPKSELAYYYWANIGTAIACFILSTAAIWLFVRPAAYWWFAIIPVLCVLIHLFVERVLSRITNRLVIRMFKDPVQEPIQIVVGATLYPRVRSDTDVLKTLVLSECWRTATAIEGHIEDDGTVVFEYPDKIVSGKMQPDGGLLIEKVDIKH